jgi:hypothetical protein
MWLWGHGYGERQIPRGSLACPLPFHWNSNSNFGFGKDVFFADISLKDREVWEVWIKDRQARKSLWQANLGLAQAKFAAHKQFKLKGKENRGQARF